MIERDGLKTRISQLRAWAEISPDTIQFNTRLILEQLQPDCRMLAVVKANGYGHGAIETARQALAAGAFGVAVATLDEAIHLRLAGISEAPILILGYTPVNRLQELLNYDLTMTLYDENDACILSDQAEKAAHKVRVHLKIDSGMTRLGICCRQEELATAVPMIQRIVGLPGLDCEGIYTHFATADEPDEQFVRLQFGRFCHLLDLLADRGIRFRYRHCANSAAILRFPDMHLDLVRPGILLYGSWPDPALAPLLEVRPAMSLWSRVIQVRDIPAGVPVSYGLTFTSSRAMRLAVVDFGYADGMPRQLSNRCELMLHGQRVPQVGTICMDRCVVDVSALDNVQIGDRVLIFGCQENGAIGIRVDTQAAAARTISYELLCQVSERVPRIYL